MCAKNQYVVFNSHGKQWSEPFDSWAAADAYAASENINWQEDGTTFWVEAYVPSTEARVA